jgi:UDP-N-acetylglucosamine acyltransferase
MAYVHVGHNCLIQDSVIIANSVALAGHVHIESRARLSGVLGVHQFVHIGTMSMVGGMTRIDRDVPPYMLVEGNPAKVRSLNLVGLKRSEMAASDFQLIKKAFRLLYRSDFLFKDALQDASKRKSEMGSMKSPSGRGVKKSRKALKKSRGRSRSLALAGGRTRRRKH